MGVFEKINIFESILTKLVVFFLMAQIIGLYTGVVVIADLLKNPYITPLLVETKDDINNAFLLFLYILIGAAVMILLIKKFSINEIIFLLLEFLLISAPSSIVFYAFLRLFFDDYAISMVIAIILALLLAASKFAFPQLKNFAAILATAGVGVVFGISLSPQVVMLFLVLLTVYDYFAVFITKHMIDFANFVIKKNLAFTITAEATIEGQKKRVDIGSGDFVAPITFEVSLIAFNPIASLVVLGGAFIAATIFLYFVWKKHIVLPALPPIVFGMFVAFLLGLVFGLY